MDDKDNYLDDEWGNIHDEVLDPKWARARTKKLKDHQSNVISKKYKDEEYYENWIEANASRWDDKEWAEKHKEKMRLSRLATDEKRIASTVANPEWQKQYGIGKRWEDPAFREKMRLANSKPRSPEVRRANIIRNGGQPFTCPWGVFDTPQSASDVSLELTGTFRSKKWISLRVKKKVKNGELVDDFNVITWEEYDRLKKVDN